ncbi:MAG: MFS transporter [Acidimicrobiales bacterium]|nr:MFS transporter [Acidimicrobiales bacterium]
MTGIMGGPARRKCILLLAAVMSLSGADIGAVSALAPQLESGLQVGNAGIGLLVTVSSLVGAVTALPCGVLADRVRRTRLLSISIVLWGGAQLLSAFSTSFAMLLGTRLALGVVMATGGPTVASLIGDLFPAKERSRTYGLILTGELLGGGAGVLLAGDIGAAVSWRVGLAILVVPSVALAWLIHRHFPEPARGGQSRLMEGDEQIRSAEEVAEDPSTSTPGLEDEDRAHDPDEHLAPALISAMRESDVAPDESLIQSVGTDPGLWEAVRWVLRVPTNISLIVASSFGYFFLGGLRTFALVYARGRFGIGQGMATVVFLVIGVAAVVAAVVSGRMTDRFISKGMIDARLVVGGLGFLAGSIVFVPALLTGNLLVALPLFAAASFALSTPNPPIDAARLDVVPSWMWGRAESIRTTARTVMESFAPLTFGLLAAALGGGMSRGFGSGVNETHSVVSHANTTGLEYAFLIMAVMLPASGVLMLRSRRTYLRDVASATAAETIARASTYRQAPSGYQPLAVSEEWRSP